ncbi:hypothetical protein NGM10_17145 (plasmid) [Halorussus salilacus]|uniref:hypothetical protein n=1 Tax=Halorussus salilacus TaxID=2953750 RepID=UPI00209FEC5A|nr:hypothetical protein [Halorussus salilacus]USZ69822.1 hypothetical protein NGM10_17145 [Halorussus salilacus]
MTALDWSRLRPVTKAAVFWVGTGLALALAGLADLLTDSCDPAGDAGCGEPFGFVLLLWGVPMVLVSGLVLVSRFARSSRDDPAD